MSPLLPAVGLRLSRHVPVLAATIAAVLVAGTLGLATRSEASPVPRRVWLPEFDLPVAMPTTTTTVVAAAPVAQPAPAPPPPAPVTPIGEIAIPRIGLTHTIYEGITMNVINKGPGHWPGSAMPGQLGNAVIAGHRTTHSKPFRNLDQLVPGDEITLKTERATFTYKVARTEIVGAKDTWIVDPTTDATVTLFACHPPGSARQRIVVRGTYVTGVANPPA